MPQDYMLTEEELVSRIGQEVSDSDVQGTNLLSAQRERTNTAYQSDYVPELVPTTGMSTIIVNKIKPAVDTLTTYLTKIFCSDRDTVIFTPSDPNMTEQANELSKMINDIIHKQNDGYDVINRWIKSAAVNKNGIVKVTWQKKDDSIIEKHKDITEEELNAIISAKEEKGYTVDIVESIELTEAVTDGDVTLSAASMDVSIKCTRTKEMPMIEVLAPEEFLINRGATRINDDPKTRFVGHRQLMAVGDLVKMFPEYDINDFATGTGDSYLEFEYETINRHTPDGTYNYLNEEQGEGPVRQIEVTECWVKCAYKKKELGWWHCFTAGNQLLLAEEWLGPIPFASFTFFPIPHKFYGMSVYDSIKDYYRLATMLARSEADMRLQQNTFRLIADPRMIDQRDLQAGRPGIIKARPNFDPASVMPLPVPSGAPNTAQMLEYLDMQIEEHIGVNPRTGAISSDVEKSGNDADKTSMVIDNASAKVEMYAREFAENGLKEVIWCILRLLRENTQLEGLDQLAKNDLSAKVGLGHMTMAQKAQSIMAIKAEQANLTAQGIMITPDKQINSAHELSKSLGYENVQDFFPSKEEAMQNNQVLQSMVQQAQMQGEQMGMQKAMQQADIQETMAKVKKITAEIAKLQSDMEIDNREALIKEREQQLEEILSMNKTTPENLQTNVLI